MNNKDSLTKELKMEQEAHDATTRIIKNAQSYAKCKAQSRSDEGDQGFPNQKDNQRKES
jgi:hypothetical protein